jgi:hypothetical protein
MQVDKSKVVSLLGSGASVTQVAQAVGCDISYISQLLGDEVVAREVAELRTADILRYRTLDDKYDDIEEKLLTKLQDMLPYFTKPDQLIKALQMVNGAKRKSKGIAAEVESGQIVKLQLPNVTINNYKITMQNNMVEVGGRSLVPMASADLMKTLESKNGVINEKEAKRLLNAPVTENIPKSNIVNESAV